MVSTIAAEGHQRVGDHKFTNVKRVSQTGIQVVTGGYREPALLPHAATLEPADSREDFVQTDPCASCRQLPVWLGCAVCGRRADVAAAEIRRLTEQLGHLANRERRLRAERAAVLAEHRTVTANLRQLTTQAIERRRASMRAEAAARAASAPAAPVPDGPGDPEDARIEVSPVGAAPASAPAVPSAATPSAATSTGQPAPPRQAERHPSVHHRPETSARSVQHLLLTLGGILLGAAAVTFTAITWASSGQAGRAAVLAAVTAVFLGLPVLAARRGLTATAETIAAVGLLLVALDGALAWSVNFLGVGAVFTPATFLGLSCLATTVVAAAYRSFTRLAVPQYAALLAAQPVTGLLAFGLIVQRGSADTGAAVESGHPALALAFTGAGVLAAVLAVQNLLTAGILLRPPERRGAPLLREVAWGLHTLALAMALALPAFALVVADRPVHGLYGGAALAFATCIVLFTARVAGRPRLRQVAAAVAVVAAVAAVARPLALAVPGAALAVATATLAAVALVVRYVPQGWQRGARAGAAVTVAVIGGVVSSFVVEVVAGALAPPPSRELFAGWWGGAAGVTGYGWQVPVAAVLVGAAVLAVAPRSWWHDTCLVALTAALLATPAAFGLAPTVALGCDGLVGFGLALGALYQGAGTGTQLRHAYLRAGASALLALHAIAMALTLGHAVASPGPIAAVLWGIVIGGGLVAAFGHLVARSPHQRLISDCALGGSLAAVGCAVATGAAWLAPAATVLTTAAAAAAAGVGLLAAASLRAARQRYLPAPAIGAAGGTLVTVAVVDVLTAPVADLVVFVVLLIAAVTLVSVDPRRGTTDATMPATTGLETALRRFRVGDLPLAVAVAAGGAAVARFVAVAMPGIGVAVAAAIAAGVLVPATGTVAIDWRRARMRSGFVAGAGVMAVVVAAVCVVVAVIHAAMAVRVALPPWHGGLADTTLAWWRWPQIPVAMVLLLGGALLVLPERIRTLVAVVGVGLLAMSLSPVVGLPWWSTPVLDAVVAVVLLGYTLVRPQVRGAGVAVGAALALGAHANAAASGWPWTTAAALGTTVGVCTVSALAGYLAARRTAAAAQVRVLVGDVAVGGGLAALPGLAVALATTAHVRTELVFAIGLATASATLAASSLVRLARAGGRFDGVGADPAPAVGAALGALATAAGVALSPAASWPDLASAAVIGVGAALRLVPRRAVGGAGATLALVASLARLADAAVPGYALLVAALVVLVLALAVRRLPAAWRRGPVIGLTVAGGVVTVVAAGPALAYLWLPVAHLLSWPPGVTDAAVAVVPSAWQPPVALLATAVAAVTVLPARGRSGVAGVLLALSLVEAPGAGGGPWWTPCVIDTVAAVGFGVAGCRCRHQVDGIVVAVAGAVLCLHAVTVSLAGAPVAATVLAAVVVAGGIVAGYAAHADRPASVPIGRAAVTPGLVALPGAVTAAATASGAHTAVGLRFALAAVVVLAGVAAALRRHRPYLPPAIVAVAAAGVAVTLATLPTDEPTTAYAAASMLVAAASGLLLLPARRDARIGAPAAAGPATVLTLLAAFPPLATVVFGPYRAFAGGAPRDWLLSGWAPDLWDAGALAALAVSAAVVLVAVRLPAWLPAALLPPAAATLLVLPDALGAPWPTGTGTALIVGATAAIAVARGGWPADRARRAGLVVAGIIAVLAGAAGLAGSMPTVATTTIAAAVVAAAGFAMAIVGTRVGVRVTGWLLGGVGACAAAALTGHLFGLSGSWSATMMTAVAVALLAVAARLTTGNVRRAGVEQLTVEAMSYCGAAVAALWAARSTSHLVAILVGYGLALGLSATRPQRRPLAVAAAGCEVLAWWVLLFTADVGIVEAYTLPCALLAHIVGVLQLRRRPALRSWVGYGPALAAAFLPSLALLTTGPDVPARRLLLLFGAVAVVAVGAYRRRQAPVVVGAVVVVAMVIHELVRAWHLLPGWIPLATAGVLLVALGATYEQRRRDVRRLRHSIGTMR